MGGSHSRRKGQSGEREFAALLARHGLEAKRGLGQARGGGVEVPDVVCDGTPNIHWEVKRYADSQLHTSQARVWADQARRDAPEGRLPVLAHRWDRGPWMIGLCLPTVILWGHADDLLPQLISGDLVERLRAS